MKVRIFSEREEISVQKFFKKNIWTKKSFEVFNFWAKGNGLKSYYFIVVADTFCLGAFKEPYPYGSHSKVVELVENNAPFSLNSNNVPGGGFITFFKNKDIGRMIVISGESVVYGEWWKGSKFSAKKFKKDEKSIKDLSKIFHTPICALTADFTYLVLPKGSQIKKSKWIKKVEYI